MDVSRLATEVFGSGRLDILRRLQEAPARYSDLAKRLRVSEGELSRNLARLVEAGLVTKHADATYTPTPLAAVALSQAPTLEFLAGHDEFVRTHALHELPAPLLRRLDDLGTAKLLAGEPLADHAAFQTVFRSVDKRFWAQWIVGQTVFDDNQLETQRELAERIRTKRTEVRIVALVEEVPLYHDLVSPFEDLVEARTVPAAPVSIALSDSHALMHFNGLDGRIDVNYSWFGDDPRFIGFVEALFEDAWSRGVPARLTRPKAKGTPRPPAKAAAARPARRA